MPTILIQKKITMLVLVVLVLCLCSCCSARVVLVLVLTKNNIKIMVAEENVNEMHHNYHSEENRNKAQPSTTENHNKAQSSTETHQHTPPSGCVCKADILVCATTSQSPESKLVASPAHLKIDSKSIIKIHSQMQRYLAQHLKIPT